MVNALIAIVTVLAVLTVRALLKLMLLPFRAVRGLWRGQAASA